MTRINWRDVFTLGVAAGLAWAMLSVPILVFAGGNIIDSVPRPIVSLGRLSSFALSVIGGIWALWLYAAIRPRYGAGPRTAALAGFSWWFIGATNSWQWSELGFIRQPDLVGLMFFSLPVMISITMVAAWRYQEKHA